jgi:ubiquinone/menaquinone biosynthesis C-methylase UbiE/acyl carrier protein
MTHQSSYKVGSFATNVEAEIRRLNAQVDLFWPAEGELLIRHGLRDGTRVLDCGCGPGRLLELMKRRLPGLKCVGVEIDEILVEAGQKRIAESGLPDCTIQQGSAENPGLEPESFDFITLRLVLEHVPDPMASLRSLVALLKPSGRLAVISNDFEYHLRTSPPVAELDALYDAYCAARRRDGGDPCIGRRVPHLLRETGLTLVACEITLAHSAVVGDGPFLRAEGAGVPAQLVRTGFLDAKVLDDMTHSWRAMLETPGHCIARPLWVAVGVRGDGWSPTREPSAYSGRPEPRGSAGPRDKPVLATSTSAVLGNVLALVASVLGATRITPYDSLVALGVDSVSALTLQQGINDLTGVEIPIVRFLEDRPVRALLAGLCLQSVPTSGDGASGGGRAESDEWEEGSL